MLAAGQKPLTTGANVNLFKSAFVCVAVSLFFLSGCGESSQELRKKTKIADFSATKVLAESGDADAQDTLGLMYLMGQGVPQDVAEAYVWFSVAAAGGCTLAVIGRDNAASNLTPEQLSQGQKRATELFEKISGGK